MKQHISRSKHIALAVGCLLTMAPSAFSDSWMAPQPTSFHSRGFSFVAEVFPPESRQNTSKKPVCYLYEMGYPTKRWDIIPRLLWKAELVNDSMPVSALVSMGQEVVTLNEHGRVGYQNAVVIYTKQGQLVKSFHLDDLISEADQPQFVRSAGSRWWNDKARYFFVPQPSRLYIVLNWDKVMEFSLTDGKLQSGKLADFPTLASLAKSSTTNEETQIWSTSLRFSSITDILNPQIKPNE
jgi:hypothetical protein